MSIKALPEIIKVKVQEYHNQYSEKLEHMFVEKIEINESTCVHKKWQTTVYELTGITCRKAMEYAY